MKVFKRVVLFSVIKISEQIYVDEGNPIVLNCNASGQYTPPDDIDWFKGGIKINPSVEKQIEITKYRSAETRTLYSTLSKKHSKMSDMGTYICRSSDLKVENVYVHVLNCKYLIHT